jgi:hypothetical protein
VKIILTSDSQTFLFMAQSYRYKNESLIKIKSTIMKKIFTLGFFVALSAIFLAGCVKEDVVYHNDEDYWLSQERGEVVYSDNYCDYLVVETYNGYTVIRSYGSYKPYEGSIVYGNFSGAGSRDMYDRSYGVIFSGTVTDYWLTYGEAQDAVDYYCPFGKESKTSSTSNFRKKK